MSMQSPDSVAFQENRVTLSCFDVGGGVYAMDVSHVREVARWQPITPLPKAPELIEGVIDLRGVTFIDSSGIGAIVFLFKRLRAANRELMLVGVHGQVRELIELLRVDHALPVELLDPAAGEAAA